VGCEILPWEGKVGPDVKKVKVGEGGCLKKWGGLQNWGAMLPERGGLQQKGQRGGAKSFLLGPG